MKNFLFGFIVSCALVTHSPAYSQIVVPHLPGDPDLPAGPHNKSTAKAFLTAKLKGAFVDASPTFVGYVGRAEFVDDCKVAMALTGYHEVAVNLDDAIMAELGSGFWIHGGVSLFNNMKPTGFPGNSAVKIDRNDGKMNHKLFDALQFMQKVCSKNDW